MFSSISLIFGFSFSVLFTTDNTNGTEGDKENWQNEMVKQTRQITNQRPGHFEDGCYTVASSSSYELNIIDSFLVRPTHSKSL